jgi:hypothetical protein
MPPQLAATDLQSNIGLAKRPFSGPDLASVRPGTCLRNVAGPPQLAASFKETARSVWGATSRRTPEAGARFQ